MGVAVLAGTAAAVDALALVGVGVDAGATYPSGVAVWQGLCSLPAPISTNSAYPHTNAVGVIVGVIVGVLVEVPVAVGVDVLVTVGVKVGLSVAVGMGVCVAVLVGSGVCVGVFVLVGVGVGIDVDMLVGVFVEVAVIAITIGAGVGSGDANRRRMSSLLMPTNARTATMPTAARNPQSMNLPQPPPFPLAEVEVSNECLPVPPPLECEKDLGFPIPDSDARLA